MAEHLHQPRIFDFYDRKESEYAHQPASNYPNSDEQLVSKHETSAIGQRPQRSQTEAHSVNFAIKIRLHLL